MNTLTEKQQIVLYRAEERVQAITGSDLGRWHIAYQPEAYPGRGHDITAWVANGEYLAEQSLDPYGNGHLVISEIDVIHNDADDDHFDEDGGCEHEPATPPVGPTTTTQTPTP